MRDMSMTWQRRADRRRAGDHGPLLLTLARPDTKHRPVSVPRVTIIMSAPTPSMKLVTPTITRRHFQV